MPHPTDAFLFRSIKEIAKLCGVSEKTARRWKAGTTCPPQSAILLLCGDLGTLDSEWSGWRVRGGKLYSPEGDGYQIGDVRSVPFMRQQIYTYHTENRLLREQVEALGIRDEQPAPGEWDFEELTA